jgi:hypothetical protein
MVGVIMRTIPRQLENGISRTPQGNDRAGRGKIIAAAATFIRSLDVMK